MLAKLAATGGAAEPLYVDDVFSTYTYTGNGSTQTITNGIDLASKGGLVWIKKRSGVATPLLTDTARGNTKSLDTVNTTAEQTGVADVTAFNGNGFSIGAGSTQEINTNAATFVSWTFRKSPKFFDVVTYTGNGANRTISHNLGQEVGMIIVKCASASGNWAVYHKANTANPETDYLLLNTTAATADLNTYWNDTLPTTSVFSVGTHADVNTNAATYIAYVFAHDAAADGIIQCGSFVSDGSGNATVNLGWEPQFVMIKRSDGIGDWYINDTMRGMPAAPGLQPTLLPNTSGAEVSGNYCGNVFATGFSPVGVGASRTYIYLAIRRPNKPPTTGTQVFNSDLASSSGAFTAVAGFPVDMAFYGGRTGTDKFFAIDRLRGSVYSKPTSTTAELSVGINFDNMTSFVVPVAIGDNSNYINWMFKRAPGVFDVVCDTGTGSAHTVSHNLTAVPELIIRKGRSGATQWEVWHSGIANTEKLVLSSTAAKTTDTAAWNSTSPTSSVFTVGTGANVNTNAARYVSYLFVTKAGISKVGSYTGNGSNQTINCGFTTGARFILIKRTDSTGDWYVWDTVRGIIAGNDPHLSLNTTVAEVTTNDSIDTDNTGFIVNQLAATNINVNAATYIYLAMA